MQKKSDSVDDEFHSVVLRTHGKWLSESNLESADKIFNDYFLPVSVIMCNKIFLEFFLKIFFRVKILSKVPEDFNETILKFPLNFTQTFLSFSNFFFFTTPTQNFLIVMSVFSQLFFFERSG